MITFDNVTKMYDSNVGLENASIHINKGDFVFLVGPSGAGKSTFIKLILKEINADSGSIIVDGQEVTTLSSREIPKFRRRIGIVFQDFRLLNKKTVYENVAFAMEAIHEPRGKIRTRVPQVLKIVGIEDQADKYPTELSAGEQQRVAIARAIINGPALLIADEPTGNLDPDTATGIMDLLEDINETGTTVVMVTHAKDIVDRMQKRVVAIDSGHIVRDETGDYGFEEVVAQQGAPAQVQVQVQETGPQSHVRNKLFGRHFGINKKSTLAIPQEQTFEPIPDEDDVKINHRNKKHHDDQVMEDGFTEAVFEDE
ncbi:MAG: cell division ATP-binding protein FtsE [Firmicutes bacterium]|nr:cell division ATP-binding protein FtsE [Bacillota bacterium]